jgi:glycosyltransferase involved in cell wall biosynthesis
MLDDDGFPRLLVASYFGAGWTSGGAVIVDGLLRRYPAGRVARFSVPLRGRPQPSSVHRYFPSPDVRGHQHPRYGGAASRALWFVGSHVQAQRAIAAARTTGADVVWSVLDFMWVPFTYRFMRATDLPVHVSVHDDPVASAELAGWPPDVLRKLERAFAFCYRHAATRDVISENMRAHYQRRYERDAIVVTSGVKRSDAPSSVRHRPRETARCRIVHVGNLLYPDEALAFAEAAHRVNGVELTFIGNVPPAVRDASARLGFDVVPWLSQAELDARLDEFDLAYLPYGFAPARELFVRTSFPTKLISYLRAGLPVIHHGPGYSSVAEFMRRHPVGVLLDRSDPCELAANLERLRDVDTTAMRDACMRAVREQFSADRIWRAWAEQIQGAARGRTSPMTGEAAYA